MGGRGREEGLVASVLVRQMLNTVHLPPSLPQMLTVRLEESDYSSAWVLASRSGLSDINTDLNRELRHTDMRTHVHCVPYAPPHPLLLPPTC